MKLPFRLFAMILLATALPLHGEDTPKKTRLFILTGQSNMNHVIPEESFVPAFKKSFPDDEVIIIKHSSSGQPIRRWLADWVGADGTVQQGYHGIRGDIYEKVIKMTHAALEGRERPDSVMLIWMQGESDTEANNANVYEKSLKAVIQNFRKDLQRPDMYFVVGRISDHTKGEPGEKTVREALVTVAESDPLGGWIDTDDLNGKNNDVHFTKQGYQTLGERFGEKAASLLKKASSP